MTEITVRQFQSRDQERCREIILSGLGDHFTEIYPELNPDVEDIYSFYVLQGHLFLVALQDREIVATGGLLRECPEVCRLVRVSVDKSTRRKKIGRKIVRALINSASNLGCQRINVETNHDWHAAIHLYSSCRFVEYDRDEESVHMMLLLS